MSPCSAIAEKPWRTSERCSAATSRLRLQKMIALVKPSAERIEAADEVVEDKGVRVLIDPKAVLFLIGTEMDYKTGKLSAQFVFNNPNQTSACGCGESVQLKPAAQAH